MHAPAWPGLEVEVEALRADPSPLANLTITKVVDHYTEVIRGLRRRRSSSDTPSAVSGVGPIFFEGVMALGFGKDHVVPTSVSTDIAAKYKKHSTALTEYYEYPDRSHFPGVDG